MTKALCAALLYERFNFKQETETQSVIVFDFLTLQLGKKVLIVSVLNFLLLVGEA